MTQGIVDELEELSGDVIVLADAEDRIVYCSERSASQLGQSRDALLGKLASTALEFPERANEPHGALGELVAGKRWAAAPDMGTEQTPIAWTGRPLFDERDRYEGAIYRGRNVARSASSGSDPDETLKARGFDASTNILIVLDRNRTVRAFNEAFRRTVTNDLKRDAVLGEDIFAFGAPSFESGFLEGFSSALAGDGVRRTRSVVYPSGTEYDFNVEYTPMWNGDRVDHVLFGAVSVENTQASRRYLPLIERGLLSGPFGLLIADARAPDLPIVYASPSIAALTGFTPAEIVGKNALGFWESQQPAFDVVRGAVAAGAGCDVVLKNQKKDGSTFFNRLALSPVRDEFGIVSHFIAIQEDVSERETLLSQLRDVRTERTQQLMLGGALHDLRNILTVLGAEVDLARMELDEDGPATTAMDAALKALEDAGALTRTLLSPLGRTRNVTSFTPLFQLVRSMTTVARYVVPKGVQLELDVAAEAEKAQVVGSRDALEHVLLNLILNARDALAGKGLIEVRVTEGIPPEISPAGTVPDRAWTISISDNGPGITREHLSRIFEPYFTTKSESSTGSGSGLGLASCAALVRAVGGHIEVRSTQGEGATFHVVLRGAGEVRGSAEPSPRGPADLRDRQVLVVEPDAVVRAALGATMKRRGARVLDAGDLGIARQRAAGAEPNATLIIDSFGIAQRNMATFVQEWLAVPQRSVIHVGELESLGLNDSRITNLAKPFTHEALLLAMAAAHDRVA